MTRGSCGALLRSCAPAPALRRGSGDHAATSGEEVVDDVSVDIGQSAVDAVLPDREMFMVDSQQMQNRGVEAVRRMRGVHFLQEFQPVTICRRAGERKLLARKQIGNRAGGCRIDDRALMYGWQESG